SDGSVVAWGSNDFGEATVPAAAAGALQVSAGGYHSLALVAPATVAFGAPTGTVLENAGVVKLTVARGGNTAIPAAVHYARTSGTATPGADFALTAGTLHFAAGETVKTIPVTITDDSTREPAESIVVSLSDPAAHTTLEGPTTSTVTIGASDQRPDLLVSTAPTTAYVGNNVYNTTGAGQTKSRTARRTQTRTFYVRVGNDGNVRNTFAVKGSRARSGSTVRFYSGTTDVTSALSSAAGWRVTLAPAAYRTVTVRIKILRGAAIGSTKQATVKATWTGDGIRVDLAKAVVKVVR
ncbi:MAG: Calx-beta domain-containing protein, partial [Nocardioides sp.]|nr:Calx-beta domain-containing protein [Nocardioides sp.]